jgi:hypothetical protein
MVGGLRGGRGGGLPRVGTGAVGGLCIGCCTCATRRGLEITGRFFGGGRGELEPKHILLWSENAGLVSVSGDKSSALCIFLLFL